MRGIRMRIAITRLAVLFNVMIVATSSGAAPQQPAGAATVPVTPIAALDENELAGLAKGSKSVVLTWERVYAIAGIRAHAGNAATLRALDAEPPLGQAARAGATDFDTFRGDFTSSEAFRDPAPDVLALLGRLQAVENARHRLFLLESLTMAIREWAHAPTRGLSRLDIDIAAAASLKARQGS